MNDLGKDLLFAWRLVARSPGLTATAVFLIALGTGANFAIYSIVHAVLLQPLPFAEPDRLMAVFETSTTDPKRQQPFSVADSAVAQLVTPPQELLEGQRFEQAALPEDLEVDGGAILGERVQPADEVGAQGQELHHPFSREQARELNGGLLLQWAFTALPIDLRQPGGGEVRRLRQIQRALDEVANLNGLAAEGGEPIEEALFGRQRLVGICSRLPFEKGCSPDRRAGDRWLGPLGFSRQG
jgi:hypothetical protein